MEKVIPALIFFSLWLDGWFLPLILIPILYVPFVEKKELDRLGFTKFNLKRSVIFGLFIALASFIVYFPTFLYYLPYMSNGKIDVYQIFSDVFHYPVYEEIAYKSFFLAHFSNLDESPFSTRNSVSNLIQSLLFVSIHKHHFSLPLVLIPILLFGILSGLLFLEPRNVFGCIFSHSILNGTALLLKYTYIV